MESLSFYRNIEKKLCVECGNVFLEQAESYICMCEHCLKLPVEHC